MTSLKDSLKKEETPAVVPVAETVPRKNELTKPVNIVTPKIFYWACVDHMNILTPSVSI